MSITRTDTFVCVLLIFHCGVYCSDCIIGIRSPRWHTEHASSSGGVISIFTFLKNNAAQPLFRCSLALRFSLLEVFSIDFIFIMISTSGVITDMCVVPRGPPPPPPPRPYSLLLQFFRCPTLPLAIIKILLVYSGWFYSLNITFGFYLLNPCLPFLAGIHVPNQSLDLLVL